MRGLPSMAPEVMFRNRVWLPRDYYVRAFRNGYSVDPAMIGRTVDVTASLDSVTVRHDRVLIAAHSRKWARQLTVTDPAHVLRAAELRAQFQAQRAGGPGSRPSWNWRHWPAMTASNLTGHGGRGALT